MKTTPPKTLPKIRQTLRVLGGRRVVVEGYGRRSPAFVAISGGGDIPVGAWLSPAQLRRFVDVARRILK